MRRIALAVLLALPVPGLAQTAVPAGQAEITLSFSPVVKAAAPSVVNIYASRIVETRTSPFAGDPFFEEFFRDLGPTQPRLQNSLGSGVIVGAGGLVVSNYHVVEQATEIRVVLNDRREFPATVLLADQASDLAILQLKGAADLPALPLRDSDTLEVGDLVLAIGNPFGVGQTVSSGIVSGLARSAYQLGDGRGYFVQTDAAINPGNSGGALVDMAGRLVGINTAILSKSGGSIGIGFAIPANLVAAVVARAEAGESRFARPWAGISAQEVDAALAEAVGLGLPPRGVVLSALAPESPFAAAGLQPGDVITALDGRETNTPQEMMFRLAILGPGAKVPVTWWRGGEEMGATLTLIAPPDSPPRDRTEVPAALALAGAVLERINPALIAERNLAQDAEGVLVAEVGGLAAEVGLKPGDILLQINGLVVETPSDAVTALQAGGRRWQVDVLRQGQPLRLRFRV